MQRILSSFFYFFNIFIYFLKTSKPTCVVFFAIFFVGVSVFNDNHMLLVILCFYDFPKKTPYIHPYKKVFFFTMNGKHTLIGGICPLPFRKHPFY